MEIQGLWIQTPSAPELTSALDDVLSSIVAAHDASFGSLKTFGLTTGTRETALCHGFAAGSSDPLKDVKGGAATEARATETRARVIIEDVECDEAFAPYRSVAAAVGFRAVQSTPLIAHSGEVLGVLSTYFRDSHRLSMREMRLADLHAKLAVDLIGRARAEAQSLCAQQELAHLTRVMSMVELTASIGHHMKQPLGAILANAGTCLRWLAHEPVNFDQARATIERIIRDAKRATEALEAPPVVREEARPKKASLDVNRMIRTAIELSRKELEANEVILHADLQELPPIWGDRVQVQQAIMNLLLNAIEALHTVTDRQRVIQIWSRREARRDVLVSIRDTGVGLGAFAREHLYEPFISTKPNALGLGLAICRRIAQVHGGALTVQSDVDCGVTVELALPAGEAV
jgi:signal transduction histidine kinase